MLASPGKLRVQLPEAFIPLLDPYRHYALFGGRGSAKSHSTGEAIVLQAMMKTERVVGARQFQNSIRESSKELIEQKIKKLTGGRGWRILDREIVHEETDSRFTFIGLERNPESAKSLEGATICWVEEARTISQTSMDILIPTIRSPGSRIYWTWNPKYKTDPVDFYFRGPYPPENSYIKRVGIRDNPWFFTTEMPAEKKLMLRANKKKHNHVWGGEYDETGDARIFNNWRIGRVPVPDDAQPYFGMDFGFKDDPNALIKLYVLEDIKTIYVAQEAVGYKIPLGEELFALMDSVTESRLYGICGDSSRPETIDYLSRHGFHVYGARKGPGSLKAGIEWLHGYTIVIDPDCVHMHNEAISYCWKVDEKTQLILPIPVDADNHCWDAVRYAVEDYRDGNGQGTASRGRT